MRDPIRRRVAIQGTRGSSSIFNHNSLRQFVQMLKALPDLQKIESGYDDALQGALRKWYDHAPKITDRVYDEVHADFCDLWDDIKHPYVRADIIAAAGEAASRPTPPEAQFLPPRGQLLAKLLQALDERHPGQPIRTHNLALGFLLGVDKGSISRWLRDMRSQNILKRTQDHDWKKGLASEHQYLLNHHGDDDAGW